MDMKVVVVRYHNSEMTEVNFEFLLNTHRVDCISYLMTHDNSAIVQFQTEEEAARFCNSIKVMMKASAGRRSSSTENYISTHYLGEKPPEPPKTQSVQIQSQSQSQSQSQRTGQLYTAERQEPLCLVENDADQGLDENQSTPPHIALALRGSIPQPSSPRADMKIHSPTRQNSKASASQSPPGRVEAKKATKLAPTQSVLSIDAKSIPPWSYYQLHITGLKTRDDFTRIIRDCSSFGKSIQKWSFYSPNQSFGSYALPQNETAQKWLAFVQENLYSKDVTGWKARISKIQSYIIILHKISPQVEQKKLTELVKSVKGKVLYSRPKVGQADLHFTKKENMVKFIDILKSTGIPNNTNELHVQPMSDALVDQMISSKSSSEPQLPLKGLSLYEPPRRPQGPDPQVGNDDDQEYGNEDNDVNDESRDTDENVGKDDDAQATSHANPIFVSKSDGKAPAKIPPHKPAESNSQVTSPKRSTKPTRDSILPAPKHILSSGSDRAESSGSISTDSSNTGSSEALLVQQTVVRMNHDAKINYEKYLDDYTLFGIQTFQSNYLSEKKTKTKGSTYAIYTAHVKGYGTLLLKEFNQGIQPDVENFISVLKTAVRLRHDNIINIIGVCLDNISLRPLGYLTENLADSNLQKLYLDNQPEKTEDLPDKFLGYMIQSIQAVSYLYTNGVTYFPLQSRNVFIVGDKVKLSEQGLGNYFREMKGDGTNAVAERSRQSKFYLANRFGVILYECAMGRPATANASVELTPAMISNINIPSRWNPSFNVLICYALRSSPDQPYFLHRLLDDLQTPFSNGLSASFFQGTALVSSLGAPDLRRSEDLLSTSTGDSGKRPPIVPGPSAKTALSGEAQTPTQLRRSNTDTQTNPTPSTNTVAKLGASGSNADLSTYIQQPAGIPSIPTRITKQPIDEPHTHADAPSSFSSSSGQFSANSNAYNGPQSSLDPESKPLTKEQVLEALVQPPAPSSSLNVPQPFYSAQPTPNTAQPMNSGTQPQMQVPHNLYGGQYAQPESNPPTNPYGPSAASYGSPTYPPTNPPPANPTSPSWNFSAPNTQYNALGAPAWNAVQPNTQHTQPPYQQTQPQWNAHAQYSQSNLPPNPPTNTFQSYAPANPQSSTVLQPQPGQSTNASWTYSGQNAQYSAQSNPAWNPAISNTQPQQAPFQPPPWNPQSPYHQQQQQYSALFAQQSNSQSVNLQTQQTHQPQQAQSPLNAQWNPHSQYPQQQNYTAPPYNPPSSLPAAHQTGAYQSGASTWGQQTSTPAQPSQYYSPQQTSSDYQTNPSQPYNSHPAQYTGQQPTQAAQYTGQPPTQAAQYTGQQPTQAAQYTGQQPTQAAQYTGQQPTQAAQYTGQQPTTNQSYQYNTGYTSNSPQYNQTPSPSLFNPFASSNQSQNLFVQPPSQYPPNNAQPQPQSQHYHQQQQPNQSQWGSA